MYNIVIVFIQQHTKTQNAGENIKLFDTTYVIISNEDKGICLFLFQELIYCLKMGFNAQE